MFSNSSPVNPVNGMRPIDRSDIRHPVSSDSYPTRWPTRVTVLSRFSEDNNENNFFDSENRPSYPFLTCLLLILTIFMLMNLEALVTPPERPHTNKDQTPALDVPYDDFNNSDSTINNNSGIPELFSDPKYSLGPYALSGFNASSAPSEAMGGTLEEEEMWGGREAKQFDSSISFPTASFNLKGRYAMFTIPLPTPQTTSNGTSASFTPALNGGVLIDEGILHAVLLSRPSVIQSVRLATVRLDFESMAPGSRGRQTVGLAGLDLRDVSTLTFQGKASPYVFNLSSDLSQNQTTLPTTCNLLASLRFDRYPGMSQSARPIETQRNGGSGDWGFDLSDFGDGGEWDRRRLSNGTLGGTSEERQQDHETSYSDKRNGIRHHKEIDNRREIRSLENITPDLAPDPNTTDISSPKVYQDLEGILISPSCRIRVVMSAKEIDLTLLAHRVVHFAFFFVLKGLLEVHFFISQVKYTDSGGSSPQKVCYVSLGLHTCVDCFESIVLLTEALTSSFMTSTFIVLAVFKLMFVSIVELRYLIIVLKARITEGDLNENLSRLVKLHAIGTAVMLIWTLKLMPIVPAVISTLYLFWVPQIVLDIWHGNRKSLSLQYVIGMSICRLSFPLYLWGFPASIFDGEIFKAPPSSPSLALSILLVVIVVVQVLLILIQRTFGPRSFVPWSCLPDVYNYYRTIAAKDPEEARGYECVICMTDVSYTLKTLVTTPCDHVFHDACLQQWMEVKAECPTCRSMLGGS